MPLTTWIVLLVPTAIVLAILIRALLNARRGAARAERSRSGPAHTEGPVVAAAADLPDDPLAFAEALAAGGRRREAMRALYGGAARRLVDAGAIRRMRTRTNAELLRDVRESASLAAPALAALTDAVRGRLVRSRRSGSRRHRVGEALVRRGRARRSPHRGGRGGG